MAEAQTARANDLQQDDSTSNGSSTTSSNKILVLGGLGRVARVFCFLALSPSSEEEKDSAPPSPPPQISVFDVAPPEDDKNAQLLLLLLPHGASVSISRLPQRDIAELDASVLSQYDVVVNTLPVSLSETVLEMASNSTCSTYVDVSSNAVELPPEQVEYHDKFRQQGRLLLSGVGIAPGLDNMLVAELVEAGATRVRIYLIEQSMDQQHHIPSWCEEDAAISATDRPVSYNGTALVQHEPFSEPHQLDTSIGSFPFYRYFGEEVVSLAHHYPTLQIDHRAGGNEVEVARDVFLENRQQDICLETTPSSDEATPAPPREPEGVFGVKIVSDVGTAEVILKSTAELQAEGLPGNHISFHTGAMLYYSLKHAMGYSGDDNGTSNELTGTVFPEQLPLTVRARILDDVKAKLATHYSIDIGNKQSTERS